jgi:hypothetical protein
MLGKTYNDLPQVVQVVQIVVVCGKEEARVEVAAGQAYKLATSENASVIELA